MKVVSASAGLFAGSGMDVAEKIIKNICDTTQFAKKTDLISGRTCDDKRSLVHYIHHLQRL